MTDEFGRVAVLMGGQSAEREVSLNTGTNVLNALKEKNVNAIGIDVDENIDDVLRKEKISRAFIALHGPGGEDGVMQGLLETIHIPYTGSGVFASALTMHKPLTKSLLSNYGLPVSDYRIVNKTTDTSALVESIPLPICVKPFVEGSSLGVSRVDRLEDLVAAIEEAAQYGEVMAEPWVVGRELTIGILGDQALPVIEIRPKSGFYDYKSKYTKGATEYLCPAPISPELTKKAQDVSLEAFRIAGCKGWGRVDLMVDDAGNMSILEINTIPGMTETSLVPKAAKELGLSFSDLCFEILKQTLKK